MKTNKKISTLLVSTLLLLSFISVLPKAYGSPTLENYIGHDFSEEKWSILYDFAGNHLEKDYTPTLGSNVTEGSTDSIESIDSKFFFTYSNIRNVHSLYVAFQNFTWDLGNTNAYGCAPYQLLIQHFRPPTNDRIHIFSLNRFLGLLAYRENATDPIKNNIPDENDSLYIGWSFYSELHKFIMNSIFDSLSAPEFYKINQSARGTATPIPIQEVSPNRYEFGMSYKNIFLLWQKISVQEGMDESVTDVELLQKCAAFAVISELNFTFSISIQDSSVEGYSEVVSTTEYDIGELTDLWILGDNSAAATEFGGSHLSLPYGYELAYYNTSNAIRDRLDGNSTTPGLSLAVINNANLMIVDLNRPFQGFEYAGSEDFVDQTGATLGASTKNITGATYNFDGNPAYKIDFASKPTYELDGVPGYSAPTRVLKNALIKTNLTLMDSFSIKTFLGTLVGKLTGSDLAGILTFFNTNLDTAQFFYVTCFPEWSGGTIYQDPTFSVFIPTGRIPGFDLLVLSLVGLCGISLIIWRIRKKNKK